MSRIPRSRLIPILGTRAVAFIPSSIAGLRLWLKADTGIFTDDAATTPAVADGDHIAVWQDQSGNAYHVSQTTDGNRPLLKLAANGINGRAALLFNGSSQCLYRTVANWLSTDGTGSVFAAYKLTNPLSASSQRILASSDEGSATYYMLFVPSTTSALLNIQQLNNDAPADSITGDTVLSTTTPYIAVWRSNGSAYTIRVNTIAQTLTVSSGGNNGDWFGDVSNRDNFYIGAVKTSAPTASFFKGSLSELLVYSTNLTGADLSNVEAYLNTRYAAY